MHIYHEDFSVFGDDVANVVGEGELAGPGGEGDQVVVVNEIVAAEGDEYERLVHKPLSLIGSDQTTHPGLVLLEVLQLLVDPDYVQLHPSQHQ